MNICKVLWIISAAAAAVASIANIIKNVQSGDVVDNSPKHATLDNIVDILKPKQRKTENAFSAGRKSVGLGKFMKKGGFGKSKIGKNVKKFVKKHVRLKDVNVDFTGVANSITNAARMSADALVGKYNDFITKKSEADTTYVSTKGMKKVLKRSRTKPFIDGFIRMHRKFPELFILSEKKARKLFKLKINEFIDWLDEVKDDIFLWRYHDLAYQYANVQFACGKL